MSDKKPPKALTIYGTAEEIEQYGNRLRFVLPGGEDLSPEGAVRAADYGKAIDANIFRGEIYAWEDHRGLHIAEGYKLLVRWARRQSDFFDKDEELTGAELEERGLDPAEDIGYRVWILREDKLPALERLAKVVDFDKAYQMIAQSAVGVVTKKDRTTKQGGDKDPPVGWTWHDVAIKRALKNALSKAYGIPSPREIAEESWMVGDVRTKAEDWREAYDGERPYTPEEQARLAAAVALERERKAEFDALTPEEKQARVEDNSRALYGDPGFEGFGDEPKGEPPPEVWPDEGPSAADRQDPQALEEAAREEPELPPEGELPAAVAAITEQIQEMKRRAEEESDTAPSHEPEVIDLPQITSPKALLAAVNQVTGGFYNSPNQMIRTIRKIKNDDAWSWPSNKEPEEYAEACALLLQHAEASKG